jgi:8-oxo-dGTP pyrophosphatase MutT (NUDIX family)
MDGGTDERPLRAEASLRERMRANLARFERIALQPEAHRPAAVAIVIAATADQQASFILTRRAAKLRAHAGQWAFPGGRVDEGESAAGAAFRELTEEVGLDLPPSALLGFLDDYRTRSGYVITPVVLWSGEPATMAPNPREVAAAYNVPLAVLGHPQVPRLVRIPESDRPVIQVPIAQLNVSVHAPTAAILYQLWEVAVLGRPTRVAHYEQPVFAWT